MRDIFLLAFFSLSFKFPIFPWAAAKRLLERWISLISRKQLKHHPWILLVLRLVDNKNDLQLRHVSFDATCFRLFLFKKPCCCLFFVMFVEETLRQRQEWDKWRDALVNARNLTVSCDTGCRDDDAVSFIGPFGSSRETSISTQASVRTCCARLSPFDVQTWNKGKIRPSDEKRFNLWFKLTVADETLSRVTSIPTWHTVEVDCRRLSPFDFFWLRLLFPFNSCFKGWRDDACWPSSCTHQLISFLYKMKNYRRKSPMNKVGMAPFCNFQYFSLGKKVSPITFPLMITSSSKWASHSLELDFNWLLLIALLQMSNLSLGTPNKAVFRSFSFTLPQIKQ